MHVVVTRQGYGDFWRFKSYAQADEHPLYQFGDAICSNPDGVYRQFNCLEMPGLLTRLGDPSNARRLEQELTTGDKKEILRRFGELAWGLMQKRAIDPPSDPKDICDVVSRDRRLTKHKEFIMAKPKKAKEVENMNDEATVDTTGDEPKAKKTRAKKEKSEATGKAGRTKLGDSNIITLLSDKEGNKYGAENNPKRAGSASHARFAKYVDGMTVKEALEAGVKRDDITWDVNKKLIELSAA